MSTSLPPSLSANFSIPLLSRRSAASRAAVPILVAAGQDDCGDHGLCTGDGLGDGERCVETCLLGLAARTCEFRLGLRALIDSTLVAERQLQTSSHCLAPCEAARSSDLGDARPLDGDAASGDNGRYIDLEL